MRIPGIASLAPRGLFYGWIIVGAALLINITAAPISPVLFSFFLNPMSEDLGWSRAALSWALTFRLVAAGATAPLVGYIIDRWGGRRVGIFAGTVVGGSLVGLAFTHELWVLYLLFAISGAVGLGGGPGASLLTSISVAKWFILKRGRAMGIATVGMAGGTVIAIPIAHRLIQNVGWQEAWMVFGLATGGIVITLSFLVLRRSPEDMGLLPDGATTREDIEITQHAATVSPPPKATDADWRVGEALRTPTLWMILVALALAGVAVSGTLVHRVGYWEQLGMSPVLVAAGTAADPFTVIFSAFIFGMLSDRIHVRTLGLIGVVWD